MQNITHTTHRWSTKRMFQNTTTGLWFDGSGFRVNREAAFAFPTHVVVVDFRLNWPDATVRWEDVEVVEQVEVVDEVVFDGDRVWS